MGLKLYYASGACSFVPHSSLELAGASFEPSMVKLHKGEQRAPEYLAINPRGQVPVLVDGDEVVTQIPAIVLYLDAKFSEAGLLPASGVARTRALQTLAWMNNTVHPTFTHVFMPDKFTDDEAAKQAIRAHAAKTYKGLLDEIEVMARQASPWMMGERPGALDAYALTLLRWGGFAGIDPTTQPATWGLAQRFAALAPVARAVEREKLVLNIYKPKA